LGELRRQLHDPALVEAAATAEQLRAEISSRQPRADIAKKLWLCLNASVSTPFFVYYSRAVGNDLGHATAHKIIEVLASLSNFLKP
jgi:hypothetical protein